MSDLSAFLAPAGFSGWAYDSSRGVIDVATSDGLVRGWSVNDKGFETSFTVGGSPGAAAVTLDGRFLLVGQHDRIVTSDPFAVQKTYADQVDRIDLNTGAVDHLRFTVPDSELGIVDIAATGTGALVTTTGNWLSIRSFDSGAASPVFTPIAGGLQLAGAGQLISSASGHLVLIEEGNATPSISYLYNVSTDTVVKDDPWSLHTFGSSQFGGGDISETKGLVIDVSTAGVMVFDLSMQPVADLGSYEQSGRIAGAAFSPDGSRAYLWQGQESHVLVLDTTSWQPVGTLEVATTTSIPNYNTPYHMSVIDGGRLLALDTGVSLELVDIPAKLNTQLAAETLAGTPGDDSLSGGAGNDVIDSGGSGSNTLFGGYGADSLVGGGGFDRINGNQGADTVHGQAGDDWVTGGKGADLVYGDDGADLVNGNIGADTLDGGAGADVLRGGQDSDSISGGAGDDWLSGDLGNDTLVGGAGADTFHIFNGGGDMVLDFNAAEGDRVQLDSGAIYTVSQSGLDTIINLGGQGLLRLVGVQLTSLPNGWIFGA